MTSSEKRSFLARVRAALPDLHPAERRLGELVCDFPGELASYSAQELAQLANVSKATVSRFVRRVGYENYEAARLHARIERRTGSRLFLGGHGENSEEASLASSIAQNKENLDRTFVTISQVEVDDVASSLLSARKTWVFGFRASHPFASYLQWQLIQVIENIVALPRGGETLGEHLVSVKPEDCVIVFGLRRRIPQLSQIIDHSVQTGAKVLYLTDEGEDFNKSATWHFRCQTQATGPLFSHVSVMAVCHYLCMRTIELAKADGRSRLRSIETLNEKLGEL